MIYTVSETEIKRLDNESPYRGCFSFLDVDICICSDKRCCIEYYSSLYGNFTTSEDSRGMMMFFVFKSCPLTGRAAVIAGRTVYEMPHAHFEAFAEIIIFQKLMAEFKGFFLLHAGVVSKAGNACIISGPSGYGKSTLTLELLSRGYGFLSDEYCVVKKADFSIVPFRRSIGVKKGSPFLHMVSGGVGPGIQQANHINCNDVFPGANAECFSKPCCFILLRDKLSCKGFYPNTGWGFDVAVFNRGDDLAGALTAIGCKVKVRERKAWGCYKIYRVETPAVASLMLKVRSVLEMFKMETIFVFNGKNTTPDFNRKPEIREMKKADAIFHILSGLLNRSDSGCLSKSCGGKNCNMLLMAAGFVKNMCCYEMTTGELSAMADIIEAI